MSDLKIQAARVPAFPAEDPNHPAPTGDVITDHLVDDGLLVEAAAVDTETLAEAEDIEATEQADVERIEAEERGHRAEAAARSIP